MRSLLACACGWESAVPPTCPVTAALTQCLTSHASKLCGGPHLKKHQHTAYVYVAAQWQARNTSTPNSSDVSRWAGWVLDAILGVPHVPRQPEGLLPQAGATPIGEAAMPCRAPLGTACVTLPVAEAASPNSCSQALHPFKKDIQCLACRCTQSHTACIAAPTSAAAVCSTTSQDGRQRKTPMTITHDMLGRRRTPTIYQQHSYWTYTSGTASASRP
jgi:hypothetical protein